MITKTKGLNCFFAKSSDILASKQILIDMAKNGKKKPSKKIKLGILFRRFTSKNNEYYDQNFTKRIKRIRPSWLLIPTKEKNRQIQLKAIFKFIEVLSGGVWLNAEQISVELSKKGYPRCHRSIKRLLKVLKDVNFNVLCNKDKVPFRYKVGKKIFKTI